MDINDICNIIGDELGKGYAECVYQEGICVLYCPVTPTPYYRHNLTR